MPCPTHLPASAAVAAPWLQPLAAVAAPWLQPAPEPMGTASTDAPPPVADIVTASRLLAVVAVAPWE